MSNAIRPCVEAVPHYTEHRSFMHFVQDLWSQLKCWEQRARERRELEDLEPRLREDLGLSDVAIKREAAKPFWQR